MEKMSTKNITESDVIALDKSDPLEKMAAEFFLPEKLIYLDGNSLGAMPKVAVERITQVVKKEWGEDLIHSWNTNNWFSLALTIGDKIGRLIGAQKGQVVVSDCVSINLFKLIVAALKKNPERNLIITESGNFPTDLYVMQGIEKMFDNKVKILACDRSDVKNQIDDKTALVVLTHAHYKSSELWDMQDITTAAHDQGALVLWDLCHSAGVVPIELDKLDVDMAVGCGYKYLNGGPGSPAFLYVAKALQGLLEQPLSGWWGHDSPFEFDDQYVPAPDIRQMQSGTQSILALAAMEVGIDTALKADITIVREKSQQLGNLFIDLTRQFCPQTELASPPDESRRGSHVSLTHDDGYAIVRALAERGVIVDFRAPDIIRFGFSPLYNSFLDVWNTVEVLSEILHTGSWDKKEYKEKAAVT